MGRGLPSRSYEKRFLMSIKILMMSKDNEIMTSLRYYFRNIYQFDTTSDPEEGIRLLRGDNYSAAILDYGLSKMNDIYYLDLMREGAPDTARLLFIESSELKNASEMVQKKHIFQFLTKPCTMRALEGAIRSGIEHHWLLIGEKALVELHSQDSNFTVNQPPSTTSGFDLSLDRSL
jgi:DNA-binding NtrC family response regulator